MPRQYLHQNKRALFYHALTIVMTPLATLTDEILPKWRTLIRLHFYLQLTLIYNVSSTSISLTLIWMMTMLNLRVFTPKDISRRPVYLINSSHDRQIASDSHTGLPAGLTTAFHIHRQEWRVQPASRYGRVSRCRSCIENLVPNVLILSEVITKCVLIIITKLVGELLNECCRSIRSLARNIILPVSKKWGKKQDCERTNRFIFFKSMFYICACIFIGVLYLFILLVNSSNELMFFHSPAVLRLYGLFNSMSGKISRNYRAYTVRNDDKQSFSMHIMLTILNWPPCLKCNV